MNRKKINEITGCALLALLTSLGACKKHKVGDAEKMPQLETCKAVVAQGNLRVNTDGKSFTYMTSGGGEILMGDIMTITHRDYPNFKLEFWGIGTIGGKELSYYNHETLNGKHIKDRLGAIRSIIFPDGTKVTMEEEATGTTTVGATKVSAIKSVHIFEGNQVHVINLSCHTVEYSSSNNKQVRDWLDNSQPDGETATFEITNTGLEFYNAYMENTPGEKKQEKVILGSLIKAEPNRVSDLFDDPRLSNK